MNTIKQKTPLIKEATKNKPNTNDLITLFEHAPRPPENVRALIAYGNTEHWFKQYENWFNAIKHIL